MEYFLPGLPADVGGSYLRPTEDWFVIPSTTVALAVPFINLPHAVAAKSTIKYNYSNWINGYLCSKYELYGLGHFGESFWMDYFLANVLVLFLSL